MSGNEPADARPFRTSVQGSTDGRARRIGAGGIPMPVRPVVMSGGVASDPRLADLDTEADRQIVGAMAAGATDALGRLFDRHATAVYSLAVRITGRQEDAEEVVQDVFAQAWRTAVRYDATRATVAGWLMMLARTRALDRLRARRARPDADLPVEVRADAPIAAGTPDPEQVAMSARDAQAVRTALAGLPDELRALVEFAYYEGLTHTEVAARTGLPLGTVKTRLRSAVAALRGALTA
jgi:RNA polymerase sigma-70 factor, ECF subfamily